MTSLSQRDVSLYELALSSEQPPSPLQISPSTFKSLVSILLDVLIEQQLPAKIWMKLPKGDVWQVELERFRKLATAPYSAYILSSAVRNEAELIGDNGDILTDVDDLDEDADADSDSLVSDQGLLAASGEGYTSTTILPLATHSQLRREYFVLIVTDHLSVLALAHRPRSVRPPKTEEASSINKRLASSDEEVERKHPLLGLCAFDSATIQRVLEGVGQAIRVGQSQVGIQSSEASDVLTHWTTYLNEVAQTQPNPSLTGYLLTKQIKQQEGLWRSSSVFRKQAEVSSALQQENEELLNAIRLKDEFLKNVGQELRAPLATMKTALSLLGSPTLKPAQRQRYMDMLSHECDRQSSLITSVLDLLQLENEADQTPMQPLRLADVVPGVVSTYQPLAQEKGIMLAYTIPEELPPVGCLSAPMRQIAINLLHNSIKFTSQGGQVWVRAKQQGEYIQLEFRDTGIGIPTTEIPKIFERFYRVRAGMGEDASGAGLGLSIVQQLLLRCGGSISVKSKVGEGSTFTVLLPIYPA